MRLQNLEKRIDLLEDKIERLGNHQVPRFICLGWIELPGAEADWQDSKAHLGANEYGYVVYSPDEVEAFNRGEKFWMVLYRVIMLSRGTSQERIVELATTLNKIFPKYGLDGTPADKAVELWGRSPLFGICTVSHQFPYKIYKQLDAEIIEVLKQLTIL